MLESIGENLHHVYFLVGSAETLLPELKTLFAAADWFYRKVETFGIDESRALRSLQTKRVAAGARRVFIIEAAFMTPEAQNALLKTLEEPVRGNHFFFIVPTPTFLLATLKSRVQFIYAEPAAPAASVTALFIGGGAEQRLKTVGQLLSLEAGDDPERKAAMGRSAAARFVAQLTGWYRRRLAAGNLSPAWLAAGRELAAAGRYLQTPGSSPKLLLEHLAIVWPPAKC